MPEVNGLYYEEHGPAEAHPLVLSAGLGGSATYWNGNVEALTAAGYRVILYDHRGTGRSAPTLQQDFTIDAMMDDLWQLLNHLGDEDVTLVGHALGGVVALCVAHHAPRLVRRVVVINGLGEADPHFVRCLEARQILLDRSVSAFVRSQPIFLYPARWSSERSHELREHERAQMEDFQGEDNLLARMGILSNLDIRARLPGIRHPVLLVFAEDDLLVPPSCSEQLAAALPNAILVRVDGGHACNVTAPEQFHARVLAWLAGADPNEE